MRRLPDLDRWRSSRALAVLLAAVIALTSTLARAAVVKNVERPKVVLSPEQETKLAEIMKKAGEAKRKFWVTRMKKEAERVTKITGLDAEGAKALDAAAGKAIDACIEGWVATFGESWRSYIGQQLDGAAEIDQIVGQLDQSVQMDWFGEYLRPFEHALWSEGLRQTLKPEQFAQWEKAQRDRAEAVQKECADALKVAVAQTIDQQRQAFLTKSATITSSLALSKERAAKLEALAATAAATAEAGVRQRAEHLVLSADDEQRKQLLKTRQFYAGVDEKDSELQQAAWKEGLAALLSPEESKQLETERERYTSQRTKVMGQILLAQLDDNVAFTMAQRARLQPIAERLVKAQPELFPEAGQENFYRIDSQFLLAAGAKATEDEMKAILDAQQWKHWQEACLARPTRTGRVIAVAKKAAPASTPKPIARAPEPEELEHGFSDFLHEKTTAERSRLLAIHLLKAEDVTRIAGLPPEAAAHLESAARGTAEEFVATWKATTESSVRSQVRDATAENIRQRLAGMESYTYTQRSTTTTVSAIWDQAIKTELTEAARDTWQKELDARIAFRDKAIAAVIMSEFDRKIPLTAEQWTKLEPLIAGAVRDYAPDIGMMFSSGSPYAWYMQSYSMFIPIAATPEKDLKAILSKDQWDRWTKSEEIGNAANYFENVQSFHNQRVKEKK